MSRPKPTEPKKIISFNLSADGVKALNMLITKATVKAGEPVNRSAFLEELIMKATAIDAPEITAFIDSIKEK